MAMNWSALAMVAQAITALIDTGKHQSITIDEVNEQIKQGGVLAWLKQSAPDDTDLSVFLQSDTYGNFVAEYDNALEQLWSVHRGNERRKWGIENSGLCLLLTWTIEILNERVRDAQQGVFEE